MNVYEQFGRKMEELEMLRGEYFRLLDVLRQVKAGEINLERVNVTPQGWEVAPRMPDEAPLAEAA